MSLDSLFRGTQAQLYSRHPNGKFDAFVSDLALATTQESNKQFLKISMITSEGKVPDFRIFLVSDSDAIKAEHDVDFKGKLIKAIQMNKGLLVRLGLVDQETVASWSQSEMLKSFATLKGMTLDIVIEDDKRDAKYQRVMIDGIVKNTAAGVTKTRTVESVPAFNLNDIPF